MGCGCILDAGAVELGADDLTLAPAPGCREPGTLLIPALALDGRTVGGRDPDPEAECVGGWMLKAGGGFAV